MFEGKELEKKLGDYGVASVDIDGQLKVKVELAVEIDLIAEVEKLAAKSSTPIDDQAIAWIKKLVAL